MEPLFDGNLAHADFSRNRNRRRKRGESYNGYSEPISLRTNYPVFFRKIFRRNIRGLIALSVFFSIVAYYIAKGEGVISKYITTLFGGSSTTLTILVAGFIVSIVLLVFYEALSFLTYDYLMDSRNVIIKKGVFAKRRMIIPFSKITDVSIQQNLLDMLFGLYDVHISTPTQDSWLYSHICGLDERGALALTRLILEKTNNATTEEEQEHLN